MKHANYTLFSPEYPPFRGGIAMYSETLAKWLAIKYGTCTVFTTNPESKGMAGVQVRCPSWKYEPANHEGLAKKTQSFLYRCYQHYFFYKTLLRIWHRAPSGSVIVTSLFFDFSRKAIRFFIQRKIPYQVVIHGLDIHEMMAERPAFFQLAVSKAQRVIFNSQFTQRTFAERVKMNVSSKVISPLLDTHYIDACCTMSRAQCASRFRLDVHHKWAISVCRLVPRKGIDRALDAFLEFAASNSAWTYIIAGEGPELEKLKRLSGTGKNVVFAGAVGEAEKYSLLAHSEVFLMPNRWDEQNPEGFGISFLEASYLRNWVVGGASGGVPEAVDMALNGFLLNDQNTANAITHLLRQIDTKALDNARLEQGRQRVIDQFSLHSPIDFE